MTIGELAARVSEHLRARGIRVVLSGGACVMLHSEGLYVSNDLDLVLMGIALRRDLRAALADLGFYEAGRVFRHPDTGILLDFVEPPLAVGKEPPKSIVRMRFSTGELELLSPTDCVKDRLASYYHFGDNQALEQVVLVADRNPVDMRELRRWSKGEGKAAEFREVERRLRPPPRGRSRGGSR